MTWVRHRTKSLAWTVLAALVLIVGQGVWRYSSGEVTPGEDVVGLVLRVVVVGLLVGVYLRAGGATTATREGLVVHDGVRRRTVPRAEITKVEEDPSRNGAVAVLRDGRRLELPGVGAAQVREVRRALRAKA